MTSKADLRYDLETADALNRQQASQIQELRREVESLRGALAREKASSTLAISRALRRKAPVEWGEDRVRISRPLPLKPGEILSSHSWTLKPQEALEIFLVWANGSDLPISTNPDHLAAWLDKHNAWRPWPANPHLYEAPRGD